MFPLCCCGGCCNLRLYTADPSIVWSTSAIRPKSCYACVSAVATDEDGDIYVVGSRSCAGLSAVVQRWSATGEKMWSVDVPDAIGGITAIAVDADGVYVGGPNDLFYDNLFALDKADGSTLWATAAGVYEINDFLVCDGILYVATRNFVEVYNASDGTSAGDPYALDDYIDVGSFEPFPVVRVLSITMDDAGNLYTAGDVFGDHFCTARGTVAKWAADRSLTWLWRGNLGVPNDPDGAVWQSAFVEWAAGHLFVVHRRDVASTYCTLERWDPENAHFVWGRRIPAPETEFDVVNVPIDGLAADDGSVWALADKSLWQWDHEGNLLSASPAEGTTIGAAGEGGFAAIAAFPGGGVVAGGVRLKCDAPDTEAKTDAECGCGDLCEPECGAVAPGGGTLVNCGWDEVPCEFTSTIRSDCEDLDGAVIRWRRHEADPLAWHGDLESPCGEADFGVTYDCESETNGGWSIEATGIITAVTITDWWCADDAPGEVPFPGFAGTFTLASGACVDCEGCLVFGTGACGDTVDICGCTGIPASPTATFTNVSCDPSWNGATAGLTYAGATGFTFAGTLNGKDFACYVTCVAGVWHIGSGTGPECALADTVASSVSCSPFQLTFNNVPITSIFGAGCGCASGLVNVTVTA